MRLYYAPGACSLAPHIVAREAGLSLDLIKVDIFTKKTEDGRDFHEVSPLGYVPALEIDGGEILTEDAVVIQYVADRNPAAGLLPAGGMERYRAQAWLGFIATELHKGFGPLWYPTTPEETKRATLDRLATRFTYLDKHLKGRDYLQGDTFTAPDAYAFTVLNWTNFLKVDLSSWPNLQAYVARVAARPQVREALKAEGLI